MISLIRANTAASTRYSNSIRIINSNYFNSHHNVSYYTNCNALQLCFTDLRTLNLIRYQLIDYNLIRITTVQIDSMQNN